MTLSLIRFSPKGERHAKRPSAPRAGRSARSPLHAEGVELVAFGVAEGGRVEVAPTQAGWALVRTAELERRVIQRLDLLRRVAHQRDHRAVARRRRLTVERLDEAQAGAVLAGGPRDEAFVLHLTSAADLGQQRVVELAGAREIVRADGDVPN